jgi:hypothetical protein
MPTSQLKIPVATCLTRSKFHTENPQVLGTTYKIQYYGGLDAGFVHPWCNYIQTAIGGIEVRRCDSNEQLFVTPVQRGLHCK